MREKPITITLDTRGMPGVRGNESMCHNNRGCAYLFLEINFAMSILIRDYLVVLKAFRTPCNDKKQHISLGIHCGAFSSLKENRIAGVRS